jgi:hypothetical protein
MYFHAIALSLFTLKYVCLRTKLSLRSALFSFRAVHICAPFVRVFSLVGRMSLDSNNYCDYLLNIKMLVKLTAVIFEK